MKYKLAGNMSQAIYGESQMFTPWKLLYNDKHARLEHNDKG